MVMNIQCNNKGCYKDGQPKLHVESGEVVCEHCGKDITNVTHFTKVSLRSLGQIYRGPEKSQKAFTVTCQSCDKQDTPISYQGELYCPHCKTIHQHLSAPYKQMLLTKIKSS